MYNTNDNEAINILSNKKQELQKKIQSLNLRYLVLMQEAIIMNIAI